MTKFQCINCRKAPVLAEQYACGQMVRAKRPVFEYLNDSGFILRFWNCPVNFIPKSVIEFEKEYSYIDKYKPKMPKFKDVSQKWLKAERIYENKTAEFMAMKE